MLKALGAGLVVGVPALTGCSVTWDSGDSGDTGSVSPAEASGSDGGSTSSTTPSEAAPSSAPDTPEPTEPDPDVTMLVAAIADEQRLLDTYDAAAKGHRKLRSHLAPLQKRQRRHVAVLRAAITPKPDRPTTKPAQVPKKRKAALATLIQAASDAEEARLADCLAAHSGALARLLASVSAAHAVTAEQARSWR